jgi:hypothetical protein
LIREKPCGTSAPFNSIVEAGTVGIRVGVSVIVGWGTGVFVGKDVWVGIRAGRVVVLVEAWHPISTSKVNAKSFFNALACLSINLCLQINPFQFFDYR